MQKAFIKFLLIRYKKSLRFTAGIFLISINGFKKSKNKNLFRTLIVKCVGAFGSGASGCKNIVNKQNGFSKNIIRCFKGAGKVNTPFRSGKAALFFGFADFPKVIRTERNIRKKSKFFRKCGKSCVLLFKRGNGNNCIKILFFKFFKTEEKPVAKSIITKFVIAAEFIMKNSFLCRTCIIKSTGKAVEISSGRNKFFGAVFAKAAAADGLSAGNAVISKKRISETFDFI